MITRALDNTTGALEADTPAASVPTRWVDG
jgi:hypothetical protein